MIKIADVTSAMVIYPSTNTIEIRGKVAASNADYFDLPFGQLANCMVNAEDDINALANATVSGSRVTLTLTDSADGTSAIGSDTDINFIATIRTQ